MWEWHLKVFWMHTWYVHAHHCAHNLSNPDPASLILKSSLRIHLLSFKQAFWEVITSLLINFLYNESLKLTSNTDRITNNFNAYRNTMYGITKQALENE